MWNKLRNKSFKNLIFLLKKIKLMLHLVKNPIVFGVLVGIVLCLLLFAHDKFLNKKPEEKSGFATYAKIFFAGFVTTAPLVFLLYNRDLSFKLKQGGGSQEIEKVVKEAIHETVLTHSSVPEELSQSSVEKVVEAIKPKKTKLKKCHADNPDW